MNNELCRFVITMAVQNSDLVDTPFLVSFTQRYCAMNTSKMHIPQNLRVDFYNLIEKKCQDEKAIAEFTTARKVYNLMVVARVFSQIMPHTANLAFDFFCQPGRVQPTFETVENMRVTVKNMKDVDHEEYNKRIIERI